MSKEQLNYQPISEWRYVHVFCVGEGLDKFSHVYVFCSGLWSELEEYDPLV